MSKSSDSNTIYLFHGSGSRFANAAFSTLEAATDWINKHEISGLLTAYDLDSPAFDRAKEKGKLPRTGKSTAHMNHAEWYVDGSRHWHFFYGIGETDPGFEQASDRWDAEYDQLNQA